MEERCSWVTRVKFSPTVYLRSGSSGLPSLKYDCKSDRFLDTEEKNLIAESNPIDPGSGSSKESFQSDSYLQLRSRISASEAKKKGPTFDSPFVRSTTKTYGQSGSILKDSITVSSDSFSVRSSLQHGSSRSSLHMLKDSDQQTADFSFCPDVITSSNPMKDAIHVSSNTCSLKSSPQHGHSQSLSPMLRESISQTVDVSFNSDLSTSMTLPMKDSNIVSSESFSCKSSPQHGHSQPLLPIPTESISHTNDFSFNHDISATLPLKDSNLVSSNSFTYKSSLHRRCSQSFNPIITVSNHQPVDFSFHSSVSTNSNPNNLNSCTPCFASSKKKIDPGYHNAYLFSDQKERKSKPKQRSVSPLPRSILSDVFKEAKCISKRFSTPPPHRDEPDKNVPGKHCSYDELKPLQQICHGKGFNKSRAKKETHQERYFDSVRARVTAVETTEKWMVDLSELYFGARFAYGAHSRLYHGRYKNQPVAVKIIRLPDDDENGVMSACLKKQFARETTFLSYLCHPNVIKLAGACEKSPIFFIITEYLSGGSLRAFLHKLDHSPLPLDKLISIALDVSRGMEYIHSQGVIHRDLKPENILFDHNFCVKIADFGVACEEAYCDVLEDDAGTYRWMAPEMTKHKSYGRKVDVYSFGLLLWEMITGAIPYEDMSPVQAAFAVVNKNMRPAIPADSPVVLRVLIEQCWSTLPEKRPEFWQIVKVLEQFESDLVCDGALKQQLQSLTFQDHKKRLLNWVEKLRPPKGDVFRHITPKTL